MSFCQHDREDLRNFFRIHDFSKVNHVNKYVTEAEANGLSPAQLFDELYALYDVTPLKGKEKIVPMLLESVPHATNEDVESVVREVEMQGFADKDALMLLKRKVNTRRGSCDTSLIPTLTLDEPDTLPYLTAPSQIPGSLPGTQYSLGVIETQENAQRLSSLPSMTLSSPPLKAATDVVMANEVREWAARVLGSRFNKAVLEEPNFVDSLRDGVALLVLLQKLQDPPTPDDKIKVPKRSTGFYARDNVASFLQQVRDRFSLKEVQMFTVSDICDTKHDRRVITCMMSIARLVYVSGTLKFAPAIIVFDTQIEHAKSSLRVVNLDRVVEEAEALEGKSVEGRSLPSLVNEDCDPKRQHAPRVVRLAENDLVAAPEKKRAGSLDSVQSAEKCNIVLVTPTFSESLKKQPATEHYASEHQPSVDVSTVTHRRTVIEPALVNGIPSNGVEPPAGASGDISAPSAALHPTVGNQLTNALIDDAPSPSNVVWKTLPERFKDAQPPFYHSRRWDGVDVVLGRLLNRHYKEHTTCPWRFHGIAANPGEYVLYNRHNSERYIVYLRIVQQSLMLRKCIKTGEAVWQEFTDAIEQMESSTSL